MIHAVFLLIIAAATAFSGNQCISDPTSKACTQQCKPCPLGQSCGCKAGCRPLNSCGCCTTNKTEETPVDMVNLTWRTPVVPVKGCPDKQESDKEYEQLTGAQMTALCESCFDLIDKSKCKTGKFCPEVTGYPWCGDKSLYCDQLGNDKIVGVTHKLGKACCGKYSDHSMAEKCGGLPCPDHQAGATGTPPAQLKAPCHTCFQAGAALNCTSIAFCTSTKYGSMPWCAPYGNKQDFACTGTTVRSETDCDKLA